MGPNWPYRVRTSAATATLGAGSARDRNIWPRRIKQGQLHRSSSKYEACEDESSQFGGLPSDFWPFLILSDPLLIPGAVSFGPAQDDLGEGGRQADVKRPSRLFATLFGHPIRRFPGPVAGLIPRESCMPWGPKTPPRHAAQCRLRPTRFQSRARNDTLGINSIFLARLLTIVAQFASCDPTKLMLGVRRHAGHVGVSSMEQVRKRIGVLQECCQRGQLASQPPAFAQKCWPHETHICPAKWRQDISGRASDFAFLRNYDTFGGDCRFLLFLPLEIHRISLGGRPIPRSAVPGRQDQRLSNAAH